MARTNKKSQLFSLVVFSLMPFIIFSLLHGEFICAQAKTDTSDFSETVVYEKGLIIESEERVVIERCNCEINGKLILKDNSSLVLKNTKIKLIASGNNSIDTLSWVNISGRSNLIAINVTIETIFFQNFGITISDNASAIFDKVYSLEWYSLICEDRSKFKIINSTCWSMIKSYDTSVLSIIDSSIYGLDVSGNSKANLKNIETTQISVKDQGFLEIYNSTISSGTEGIKLYLNNNTKIKLKNFSTTKGGFDYHFCKSWSLYRDNDVNYSGINVSLYNIYLKEFTFIIPINSNVEISNLNNSIVNVKSYQKILLIQNSSINKFILMNNSTLNARFIDIHILITSQSAQAYLNYSTIKNIKCANKSKLRLKSSKINSIYAIDHTLLLIDNCNITKDIKILENSIMLCNLDEIKFSNVTYERYTMNSSINVFGEVQTIKMIIDKNRIRDESKLRIYVNNKKRNFIIKEEKDVKKIYFDTFSDDEYVTILMGSEPPKHIPFYLTLVGQKLISLFIIIILILAVLLAWR